ncbi:hypothetical protein BG006_004870, partial [Podila minutissima]
DFDCIVKANEWSDTCTLNITALYVNEVCKVLLFQSKNPKDHAKFKKMFLDHYQNDEYKTHNYNAAHNYCQPDNKSADAFIVKMMHWFECADIKDDATCCCLFSNATNKLVLCILLQKSPKTFAEMITLTQAEGNIAQVLADCHHNHPIVPQVAPLIQDFRAASTVQVPTRPLPITPAISIAIPAVSVAIPATPQATRDNVDVNDLISQMGKLSLADINTILSAMGMTSTVHLMPSTKMGSP